MLLKYYTHYVRFCSFDVSNDLSLYILKKIIQNLSKRLVVIPSKMFKNIIFEVISSNLQVISEWFSNDS